jgi:hypothetical protein
MGSRRPLEERLDAIARGGASAGDADTLLEHFLAYVAELGLELYPAQEEAVLEIMSGRHVVMATPTGSGKSLVATAHVFRTLANGGRAFYTCPIKALVNEKFFALCDAFGAERVGMMTGDATINPEAPVICCTAEIVASMALRRGIDAQVDGLVMDEFHYYGDRDRGAAWHIPLLVLERTHFLLMSATLGEPKPIVERLEALTHREAAIVESAKRPVPLDFEWSEEPLHEQVRGLVERGRAPVYVVCFTQRACAEEAQNLMSENYCSKEEKRAIAEALEGTRWDSPYGKEIAKFVRHGIGLHHAGLLPKYRREVEKLAQRGLLKIVCGTDTLGVGVNVPLRTVLFTKLCKYDGEKTTLLSVREFQQIAGRAGRKGFDDHGFVVVQAPEHVIENKRIDAKKEQDPKKYKKLERRKPPTKGYVHWDRAVFERLVSSRAEELAPRLTLGHGMLIDLLDNPHAGKRGGYGLLLDLLERSHLPERDKRRERKLAPQLFRALRKAGIVEIERREGRRGSRAIVSPDLQRDFSMHHALSLYLLELVPVLWEGRESDEAYAFDVLSAVEAVLESPRVVLERQTDKAKGDKIAELKAAGVEYEERMRELEKVEHPKPLAEVLWATFEDFSKRHPWVAGDAVRPKSIARDMVERWSSFDEYVREYDLSRAEGVLLRYLSDFVKTLEQTVPAQYKTDLLDEHWLFLRDEVRGVDSSLLDEWEERTTGAKKERKRDESRTRTLADDPKALLVRVRRELHRAVRALAAKDWAAASAVFVADEASGPKAVELAMAPYFAKHGELVAHHEARTADKTTLRELGPGRWEAFQTLVDPERENDWVVEAEIELRPEHDEDPSLPLLRLRRIDAS